MDRRLINILIKLLGLLLKVIVYGLPVIMGLLLAIWASHVLIEQEGISEKSKWLVEISFGIFVFLFLEWIIFRAEKSEFQKEMKQTLLELKESKSQTERILNEFAEANMILESLMQSIRPDLVFDKKIKMDKEHLDFHLFLSKIKYQKFLSSHFVYHSEKKFIEKIPKYYFEDSIWKKLIGDSKIYSSLQLLDKKNTDFYTKDPIRRDSETTFLITKLSQVQLKEFHKLFVLQDIWIDMENKIITDLEVKTYLKFWLDKFNTLEKKKGKAELKIINFSSASIDSKPPTDIGIFDNILGIQLVKTDTESDFNTNSLRFDFSLDLAVVREYKQNFDTIFKKANCLKDFFCEKNDVSAK